MVKRLLFLCVLLVAAFQVQAQLPPPCGSGTEPAEDCQSACISCDFNGYTGTTANFAPGSVPSFCSMIQNDQWIGFIAGANNATFTVTPSNCTGGNGVQVALYGGCGESFIACNGGNAGNGNVPTVITAPLVPGTNYYLLIDGYSGDQCDIAISVSPPNAVQAQPLGPVGALAGPTKVCPGATVTYSVPNVMNAGGYTWSVPPGALVNGEPSGATFDAPGGSTVQVTFGNTGGDVCVQAANSCFQGGTACRSVQVVPIPPTTLPKVTVCNEDAPYQLPWGTDVNVSGNYSNTYSSFQGCDSVVQQMVVIKPPIITQQTPKTVCVGTCITVCGEQFCETGQVSQMCTSFQGCDSLVTFQLTVLDPIAQILGGGSLSCVTTSILLESAASAPNTVKLWKTLSGMILAANANSVTITQPGTIILVSTQQQGGVTCSQADTIVITANTTAPTATATTNGTLGCGSTNVSVGVITNAPNPTYQWMGPGGFTSASANPSVTVPGTYSVTVTSGANGCVGNSSITVGGNTTPPTATATGGTLTCATTSLTLSATSNATNPTYSWSGPGGYTGTGAMPAPPATAAGTYTVTVTNPANMCTKTATAVVTLNNTPPTATATVAGAISCQTPNVTITASTPATNPTYAWSGPVTVPPVASPSVGTAGTYTVTVTGGANGCTSTASVTVMGNTTAPNVGSTGAALSCTTQSATIMGTSTTTGATFAWTGPAPFTSTLQNPSVSAVGSYVLTVTGPNGCTSSSTAVVTGDFAVPNASATGATISCASSTVTINGNSTTTGATYAWAGPGGFTSTQQNPTVNATGTYTLTVRGPNGCTATATASVVPDANVPNATASGGTLNCNVASLVLNGASSTAGTTPSWTGPGGFTSSVFMPTVTVAGTYTLTVNNPANGCTAQATAVIVLDNTQPGATATGGTLTCTNPNFTLMGTATATDVSWSWTGPGGFMSSLQNPVATDAGTYTLLVTDMSNGCTSSTTTQLLANTSAPTAAATTGNLTCTTTSIQLNGSSTLPGSYMWSGPGGFSANTQNVTVTVLGDYTVTVTAANGCTDAATVTVTQDIAAPGATAQGATIDCTNPQVQISSTSTTTGVSYLWSGPGSFSATTATTTVGADGTYTVTITGPNGCTSTASAVVVQDTESPTLQLSAPTALTCALTSVDIQATVTNPTSPVQTLAWTGPGAFTSSLEDPAVTAAGIYTLLATSANGCTTEQQVTVNENIALPNATAQGGMLTCTTTSLNLNGGSTTPNAEFAWTGPGGFTSTQADPSVTLDGTYILTVTGSNGCTASATTTVTLDALLPGAMAASTNDLDCDDLSTTLQGSTSATNVTYAWTGPGGFTSTLQNPTATMPGNYSVTITATSTGCSSVDTVGVSQDIVLPNVSTVGDTLDCISGNATLTGSSTTSGVSYMWTGPGGFTSTQQNPSNATVPGTYILTVTSQNACTSSATALVEENNNAPQVTLSPPETLTCKNDTLTLTGTITSPASGFTATWTSTTGFTSTQPSIQVTVPDTYTYTVINTANGCKVQPSVTITQDIQTPQAITATGGLLNCTSTSISLDASTTTTGVTYAWTGPGGFTSTQQNPSVTNPGAYVVVVTSNANGCTDSATATVTQDPTVPDIIVTTDTLTCVLKSVVLNAETTTPNVTFSWVGPDITAANMTQEDPTVGLQGSYTVTATAVSGCTSTFDIVVAQDVALPNVAAQGDTLTCTVPTGSILATSTTTNVSYLWNGPGGFTSTIPNPSVTLTGAYTILVTAANGCTKTSTVNVVPDASLPQLTITGGTVSCKDSSVTLMATSTVPVTWNWSGPGGFTSTLQNPTVTLPGAYSVVATAPNGCSTPSGTDVLADTDGPNVTLSVPAQLNCTTTQVGLSASVQPAGNYGFVWSTVDGNIVSGANTPTPQVSAAANYVLMVTDNSNGCVTTSSLDVVADPSTPSAAVLQVRDVSCFGDTNGSIAVDSVVGGTAPLLFSIDNLPFTSTPSFSSLPPGIHTILIQDANGCEYLTSDTIFEPEELIVNLGPDTTIHLGQMITLSLDNIVNDTSRISSLVITPADLLDSLTFLPTYSFRYRAVVVDDNGCKASDDRNVIVDKTRFVFIPNIFDPESTDNSLFMIFGGEDVVRIKSFQVFDRWGEIVHEYFDFLPNDAASGWNGKVRGKTTTPAVYVYYAEIEFIDGETVLYKGDVTLKH